MHLRFEFYFEMKIGYNNEERVTGLNDKFKKFQ